MIVDAWNGFTQENLQNAWNSFTQKNLQNAWKKVLRGIDEQVE